MKCDQIVVAAQLPQRRFARDGLHAHARAVIIQSRDIAQDTALCGGPLDAPPILSIQICDLRQKIGQGQGVQFGGNERDDGNRVEFQPAP